MKTKNNLHNKITAMQKSNWLMPALMAWVLVVAVLGATGCTPHH